MSSALIGLFDGMLPLLVSIYLNPLFGHLSNLHAAINYFTFGTNYVLFFATVLSTFMFIKPSHTYYLKFLITVFTPILLKFLGYYFLDFSEPTTLPNGILYMLTMQVIVISLHFYASVKYISSKILYFSFFVLGLSVDLPFSPQQVHSICIGTCYLIYMTSKTPAETIKKSKSKSNLKIEILGASSSFHNFKLALQLFIPIACFLSNNLLQNQLLSPIGIVASKFSRTGIIQVLYHDDHKMNTIRAGHSLIGGMYLNGDCIWGSFYFHEFSRLIKRPNLQTTNANQRVVSIGVGIGVTANSFSKLNYSVVAVDIDPVVLDYAQMYFGLSKVELKVMGGREYLTTLSNGTIDYLCHDVFSGGSSPQLLFSTEFFEIAKSKLKKNGVFTINLVSHLVPGRDMPLKLLLLTLNKHFKYIHGYRDGTINVEHVQNIVLYCTDFEIEYRQFTNEEVMGSDMRRLFLNNMAEFRIRLEFEKGEILTDTNEKLNENSFDQQFEHWAVMNMMVDKNTWIQYE